MKAKIKNVLCTDVENLESYQGTGSYCIGVQISLGLDNQEGADTYSVEVCSAQYLQETYEDSIINLRHTILMNDFSYPKFIDFIEKTFCTLEGEDWNELALKLSRYGSWEFEDYKGY